MVNYAEDVLVSASQIAGPARVTIGTVWHWNRTISDFPKPLKISGRCTRWKKSEIDAWFNSRRVG